ncbi:hypothetical protein BDY21DRAFT_364643 [Lineolata rhizophorae]|uniref:Uncharacterized protein n=1 Tax=Lineolata rhizophorae TaxID=578093 RepID=A0A6A6NY28_9PEZI|nr:hypothetical protein BDY21DRAFT_364643 [Lineolata rhizophorae]
MAKAYKMLQRVSPKAAKEAAAPTTRDPSPPPSPLIERRPLSPDTEAQLRAACVALVKGPKPAPSSNSAGRGLQAQTNKARVVNIDAPPQKRSHHAPPVVVSVAPQRDSARPVSAGGGNVPPSLSLPPRPDFYRPSGAATSTNILSPSSAISPTSTTVPPQSRTVYRPEMPVSKPIAESEEPAPSSTRPPARKTSTRRLSRAVQDTVAEDLVSPKTAAPVQESTLAPPQPNPLLKRHSRSRPLVVDHASPMGVSTFLGSEDDSCSTPLTGSSDNHNGASTGLTSAVVTPSWNSNSKRASQHLSMDQHAAMRADTAAAEWMRQEFDKRRTQYFGFGEHEINLERDPAERRTSTYGDAVSPTTATGPEGQRKHHRSGSAGVRTRSFIAELRDIVSRPKTAQGHRLSRRASRDSIAGNSTGGGRFAGPAGSNPDAGRSDTSLSLPPHPQYHVWQFRAQQKQKEKEKEKLHEVSDLKQREQTSPLQQQQQQQLQQRSASATGWRSWTRPSLHRHSSHGSMRAGVGIAPPPLPLSARPSTDKTATAATPAATDAPVPHIITAAATAANSTTPSGPRRSSICVSPGTNSLWSGSGFTTGAPAQQSSPPPPPPPAASSADFALGRALRSPEPYQSPRRDAGTYLNRELPPLPSLDLWKGSNAGAAAAPAPDRALHSNPTSGTAGARISTSTNGSGVSGGSDSSASALASSSGTATVTSPSSPTAAAAAAGSPDGARPPNFSRKISVEARRPHMRTRSLDAVAEQGQQQSPMKQQQPKQLLYRAQQRPSSPPPPPKHVAERVGVETVIAGGAAAMGTGAGAGAGGIGGLTHVTEGERGNGSGPNRKLRKVFSGLLRREKSRVEIGGLVG